MTALVAQLVIACHDPSRPLERAVSSVLSDPGVHGRVGVIVVAHGIDADDLSARLDGIDGHIRVVAHDDGIRSAAGPFNHGLDLVDAEYCGVMGSDDFLEPGTMRRWLDHVEAERPDAAVAQIRLQGETIMPNPLVRLGRTRRLDAAKDRLFYRTAPLGLIRTERMRELGLRMVEGLRVGEDFSFGIQLWAGAGRVDLLSGLGCYVIGQDARERTTYAPIAMSERLEPVNRLFLDGVIDGLHARYRAALAVKLIRVTVVGIAQSIADTDVSDDEVAELAALLRRLLRASPRALRSFNRKDRRVLDGLLTSPTIARLRDDVRRSQAAGRAERWLTPDVIHSFARESTLRRYVLYYLKRERGRDE